jgi:hypothetical protein
MDEEKYYCGPGKFTSRRTELFPESCKQHDKDYDKGGYFLEKIFADVKFLYNMLEENRKTGRGSIFLAFVYFILVLFGGIFTWRRRK